MLYRVRKDDVKSYERILITFVYDLKDVDVDNLRVTPMRVNYTGNLEKGISNINLTFRFIEYDIDGLMSFSRFISFFPPVRIRLGRRIIWRL